MSICYNLLREKKLCQVRQIIENLGIKVSSYKSITIKENYRDSLQYLEKGSILAIEDFEYLGNTFLEIIDNLNIAIEREITLICLNNTKIYHTTCPEYSFLSTLNRIKKVKIAKSNMTRLKTLQVNGTKPGRRSVYTKETEIMVHSLKNSTDLTISEICKRVNICKSTYYTHYNQKK